MLKYIRIDEHPNPKIAGLISIIHWQGRFIVLLLIALFLAVLSHYVDFNLPEQQTVAYTAPFEQSDVQYYFNVYQNNKLIPHGGTATNTKITALGQIYDAESVMEKWPDFTMFVNNDIVPITMGNGVFQVELTLKDGPNVIEASYRVGGQEYERKQVVIYHPNQ